MRSEYYVDLATAFIVGIIIGACLGWSSNKREFQHESVNHHAAHYDLQTGKWQWNDEVRP